MKKKTLGVAIAAVTLAACTGDNTSCTYTPLLGEVGTCDTTGTINIDNGTGATAKLLTGDYTASRIEYDAINDQLIVESLPFGADEFTARYDRVPALDVTGYKAFRATKGLDDYIAYYGTSSTGNTASAIVAQGGYADHGHAGAGYARSTAVSLPSAGQKVYATGAYVGLRTENGGSTILDIIKGDIEMQADFSNGKVRGFILNRTLTQSQSAASAGSDMTLTETDILRDQANFTGGSVSGTVDGTAATGEYEGVFGGPTGTEIAGVVVINYGTFRETGSFIAEQ